MTDHAQTHFVNGKCVCDCSRCEDFPTSIVRVKKMQARFLEEFNLFTVPMPELVLECSERVYVDAIRATQKMNRFMRERNAAAKLAKEKTDE